MILTFQKLNHILHKSPVFHDGISWLYTKSSSLLLLLSSLSFLNLVPLFLQVCSSSDFNILVNSTIFSSWLLLIFVIDSYPSTMSSSSSSFLSISLCCFSFNFPFLLFFSCTLLHSLIQLLYNCNKLFHTLNIFIFIIISCCIIISLNFPLCTSVILKWIHILILPTKIS